MYFLSSIGRGRAELARLIFAEAGVKYDDERVGENWPQLKASGKLPFGQLPALEVDGHVYAQSMAIARYLARKFGLAGESEIDGLRVDMILEELMEISGKMWETMRTPAEKLADAQKSFSEEFLPKHVAFLEKQMQEGGGPYFLGNRVSAADLALFNLLQSLEAKTPDDFANLPGSLRADYDAVAKRPGIAAWIAARPETQF